jgi:ribonuclease BN (tRNA processing enzyme)
MADDTVGPLSLRVTILGSSGTYAGPRQACSGYLLRSGRTTVLLDAGPGTLANLQEHVALDQLDAVVVSHAHPDHWLEVPVMRNALRYVIEVEGIDLFSTSETLDMAERICQNQLRPTFRPQLITDRSEFSIGDLSFRCSRTDHPPETLAMRVDWSSGSFGYSADTGPGWSIDELGRGLDLGIIEATYLDRDAPAEGVHLSAHQAGTAAREADVKRLVITHVQPTGSPSASEAEATDAYGAAVEAARPHQTYVV